MGAEIEAQVWCDGPASDPDNCPHMNSEYGPSIIAVRLFLSRLGWTTKKRQGKLVDLCPTCKEG